MTNKQLIGELTELHQRITELEALENEHKRAEEALRESEERYRTAIEYSNDGISIAKGDINLFVNQKYLEIFGYSDPNELVGKSISIVVHPDDREHVLEYARKRRSGEEVPSKYEYRGIRKDGSTIYIEVSIAKITYRKEDVMLAYLRDITERKNAEEAVRRSKEFTETVFNSMNDAISIINVHHFKIIDVNQVFLDKLGMKRDEVIGKTCYEITHHRSDPCKPPDDICPLLDTLITGKHSSTEHVHYSKNGEKVYAEVSTSPIKDENGELSQVIHVSRDITERKHAEKKLIELIIQLQKALAEVKTLKGIFPICASCKKIRDDKGYWSQVEVYIRDHSEAEFSHSICPECMKKLYPDFAEDE